MSNRRKDIDDVSRSYLKKKGVDGFPYSKLYREKVAKVRSSGLNMRAQLTYFYLHNLLYDNGGFLPNDPEGVAEQASMSVADAEKDIAKLIKANVLRRSSCDKIYEARMAEDSGRLSEISEISEIFPKISQTSQKSDLSPGENGNKHQTVYNSRVEDTSSPLKGEEEVDSTLNKKTRKTAGALRLDGAPRCFLV